MNVTPQLLLGVVLGYFVVLIIVSLITSRKAGNAEFFIAGRRSPWFLVAFGMVGASLSGVTFISIPGVVGAGGANQAFSYMQIVLGYIIGYALIANVLMPLYYRLGLISIYGYLESRFGIASYKTGSAFFMLSRTIGSSFRLFLVVIVMQQVITGPLGIPFWCTCLGVIMLIWVYTFKGGIKTIVYTDTFQTFCMLGVLIITILELSNALDLSIGDIIPAIAEKGLNKVFYFNEGWADPNNFFKQMISGALITIVMTGLDQDMMQKNLTCKSIGEAKKNMFAFTCVLTVANLLFLTLGALLYLYAAEFAVEFPSRTDQLYPTIAMEYLPPILGILFILGLTAAAYSSADSTLTALTTAFCMDFLGFNKRNSPEDQEVLKKKRLRVHIMFSFVMFFVILLFNSLSNEAVINQLFIAAGYTYGPLLGLFAFGIGTKRILNDRWAPAICIAAPILTWVIDKYNDFLLGGFELGFLVLALNGILTFGGLWAISNSPLTPLFQEKERGMH
ncbi:MAG TPA: sodium:solute symporter [Saprospiraceae bacterium]|nr:sodium:solute symporter [Saprospiraceae bacterium]